MSSETDAHPEGLDLEILYSAVPLRDGAGHVVGALEVVTDQTALKRTGEPRRAAGPGMPAVPRPLTAAGSSAGGRASDGRAAATSLVRPGDGAASDLVALEEPLEIRIAGETVGVLMRTPGDDHRLALGFLFSEGIVESASEFSAVYHCGRPGDESYGSAHRARPGVRRAHRLGADRGHEARLRVELRLRRLRTARGGGPRDGARRRPTPIAPLPAAFVGEKVAALRDHQPVFAVTGGDARRGALGARRHARRRARGRGTAQRGRQGRGGAPPRPRRGGQRGDPARPRCCSP